MPNFLVCFQFSANIGYAIEPLEITFFKVASFICGNEDKVFLGYKNFDQGKPRWLDEEFENLVEIDFKDTNKIDVEGISKYIKRNDIKYVLGFGLPVGAKICKAFKKGGVKKIISYWGAPMSRTNKGLILLLKKLQVMLIVDKPDHFIFESYGMQRTATHGRGIKDLNTSVVHLGIDVDRFTSYSDRSYAYRVFAIPKHRKIIFYAGHMEKRKGVDVIIKAATRLINTNKRNDLHFILCGNRPGEEQLFLDIYKGTMAEEFITFGGYRQDIPELMASSFAAVIASTGWDSFPRSSLEMAAAGLPLLVSNLAGLNETIESGSTGLLFNTGDYFDLADKLAYLADNTELRNLFSKNAVERVNKYFTLEIQRRSLIKTIESVINN